VWLAEEPANLRQVRVLLAPSPAEELMCWPVSARFGNVRNNDPSLIAPFAAARLVMGNPEGAMNGA
jgi:putative SOS response-associated peptidase YedK